MILSLLFRFAIGFGSKTEEKVKENVEKWTLSYLYIYVKY